jgi:beta-glucosidase
MAGITIASTWDKGAFYRRGYMMGEEFKGKGVNIALFPVCGPIGKNPEGGR